MEIEVEEPDEPGQVWIADLQGDLEELDIIDALNHDDRRVPFATA